jgi:hypothetical protein
MRISNSFKPGARLAIAALWLITSGLSAAKAEVINVGHIQLASGNPVEGLTSIIVANITGPGCDATFNSCSVLTFSSAVLRVNYLDEFGATQVFVANLPDGFGPGLTDPAFFPDFTFDATGWTLGLITISGILSPSTLLLFDPIELRQLQPAAFSGMFDASTDVAALLSANAGPFEAAVPEPSAMILLAIGISSMMLLAAYRRAGSRGL